MPDTFAMPASACDAVAHDAEAARRNLDGSRRSIGVQPGRGWFPEKLLAFKGPLPRVSIISDCAIMELFARADGVKRTAAGVGETVISLDSVQLWSMT